MGDGQISHPLLNQIMLNLESMGSILKCNSCNKLMNQPKVLPCKHVICSPCATTLTSDAFCPLCKQPFLHQDLRPDIQVETVMNIYNTMNSMCTRFRNQRPHEMLRNTNVSKPIREEQNGPGVHESKSLDSIVEEGVVHQGSQTVVIPNFQNMKVSNISDEEKRTSKSDSSVSRGKKPQVGNEDLSEHDSRDVKRQKVNNKFKGICSTMLVECRFCHSSGITEGSGEIKHYLNDKLVDEDQASQPNVIHVHQKCVDWAPKIYFEAEKIMNLEEELDRASQIKCSSCGEKGAALGCYIKTCRKSFHVPCAYEIPECRWDYENYLMLCPAHSSRKLPCDISKPNTSHSMNNPSKKELTIPPGDMFTPEKQSFGQSNASSSFIRNLLLCGSALSVEDKKLLVKFADLIGTNISESFNSKVTHVIASTDEDGACTRSSKFLMAILSGKWVVNMKWIREGISCGHPVGEEDYEITHDVHGSYDGPRRGRIRVMDQEPKLFDGLSFYFNGYTSPAFKNRLEVLVLAAGGILQEKDDLTNSKKSNVVTSTNVLVVYNSESYEDCSVEMEYKEAKAVACIVGGHTVPHRWILDSIAGCAVLKIS